MCFVLLRAIVLLPVLLDGVWMGVVTLAMCLGLRVSEILGLRWEDVDLEGATLQVRRSVVNGYVEDTKTLASEDELPLHPDLVGVLRQWREAKLPVKGWLFGNIDTGKPYHPQPH
jgi:integrase